MHTLWTSILWRNLSWFYQQPGLHRGYGVYRCKFTYYEIPDFLLTVTQIWISPITYNIEEKTGWGESYHGYWQEDMYRLNKHFGSADNLKELSSELHRRGMVWPLLFVEYPFSLPRKAPVFAKLLITDNLVLVSYGWRRGKSFCVTGASQLN